MISHGGNAPGGSQRLAVADRVCGGSRWQRSGSRGGRAGGGLGLSMAEGWMAFLIVGCEFCSVACK